MEYTKDHEKVLKATQKTKTVILVMVKEFKNY